MSTAPASRWKIIVAFGLVYVFWGSTYLGIGIAVKRISGRYVRRAFSPGCGHWSCRSLVRDRTPHSFFGATA